MFLWQLCAMETNPRISLIPEVSLRKSKSDLNSILPSWKSLSRGVPYPLSDAYFLSLGSFKVRFWFYISSANFIEFVKGCLRNRGKYHGIVARR